MQEIIKKIGVNALLEQGAEECAELNQALLKLSRKFRGENPTPVDVMTLLNNVCEEMADVMLCIEVIMDSGIINPHVVDTIHENKLERWKTRLNIIEKGE